MFSPLYPRHLGHLYPAYRFDGVISDISLESESFNDNMLDYPVYTKPRDFRGMVVPEVLTSGNHKLINEYRDKERKRITEECRKDLL